MKAARPWFTFWLKFLVSYQTILRRTGIGQRLADFFCKGPDNKYFRLCRPYGLCHNFSPLPQCHKNSSRQYVNEETWLCSNLLTYSRDTEIWISYDSNVPQTLLSMWNPILAHRPHKNNGGPYLDHGPVCQHPQLTVWSTFSFIVISSSMCVFPSFYAFFCFKNKNNPEGFKKFSENLFFSTLWTGLYLNDLNLCLGSYRILNQMAFIEIISSILAL